MSDMRGSNLTHALGRPHNSAQPPSRDPSISRSGVLEVPMRSRLLWLVAAVALIASPSPGWAQRTTGDIRGEITDESGAVLPGVTVTLRGPAVQGTPTTVSNELGRLPVPESRPWRLRDRGRTARLRHQDADQHPGHPRHHAGSADPDDRQHAAGDDYRRRRFSDRRRRHHRAQLEHDARMGRERPTAPVHVLRPHQRRAGRLDGEHLRLAIVRRSGRRPTRTCTSSMAPTSPRRSPAPPGRGRTPTRSKKCRCCRSVPTPSTATSAGPCSTSSPGRARTSSTATRTSTISTRTSPVRIRRKRRTSARPTTGRASSIPRRSWAGRS